MQTTDTRTTKTETITRSMAIAKSANGTCVANVTEAHHRKNEPKMLSETYFLRNIVSQIGGTAIEVEKLGEGEVHHVLLAARGNGHTCDCKWGTYKSHVKPCRHVEMCLQALQEGKITVPEIKRAAEPETKPAALPSNNPCMAELRAMKLGEVCEVNGHRVERFAAAFLIDERFASSPREIAECLKQAEPCRPLPPPPQTIEFDDP